MCYDIPFVVGFCLSFCILFMSCISYHVIMCIAFAYVFVSCIRALSPLSILQSGTPTSSGAPLFVSFRERVLNILGMDRGLSSGLGIPPVKFRSIWRSFGTPTVNRATAKSFCVLQQTPLQTAQNPSKSLPCSRSFDHDRVGENRTPFGVS